MHMHLTVQLHIVKIVRRNSRNVEKMDLAIVGCGLHLASAGLQSLSAKVEKIQSLQLCRRKPLTPLSSVQLHTGFD